MDASEPITSATISRPVGSAEYLGGAENRGAVEFVCDVSLIGAIVGVPLMTAGIQEVGTLTFVGCTLVLTLAWSLRQLRGGDSGHCRSAAEPIIILSLALVGAQLVSLPAGLLAVLSPLASEYLSVGSGSAVPQIAENGWRTISLAPAQTRAGLVRLLAYSAFFLVLVQHLRTLRKIDWMLRVIATSSVLMALIGLAQMQFGNGRYLWLIEHPYRSASGLARGTFTNPNHFAGFLSLGVGPLMWCWLRDASGIISMSEADPIPTNRSLAWCARRWRRAWGVGLILVVTAALCSGSQGGISAVVIALGVSTTGWLVRGFSWRTIGLCICGAVAVLAVATAGSWLLTGGIDWTMGDEVNALTHGRARLWRALLDAAKWLWPVGAGLGSHAEVYPLFLNSGRFRYSHAENAYLQILVELGLPGVLLLCWGLMLCSRWCLQVWRRDDQRDRRRMGAIAAGLFASAVHSCVDFVWYLPGFVVLMLALAACACRYHQLAISDAAGEQSGTLAPPSGFAWLLVTLMLPTALLSADVLWPQVVARSHESAYRKLAVRASKMRREMSMNSVDSQLDEMIGHLEDCMLCNPHNARAAGDLAALLLRRCELTLQTGDTRMTLSDLRDVVSHGDFSSPREVREWLEQVMGEATGDLERAGEMAGRSLQGQPLRGEMYLVLSEVGLLRGPSDQQREALLEQAVRLRPHDPAVLYAAGLSATQVGEWEQAFAWWRRACVADPAIEVELLRRLAPLLGSQELCARLNVSARGLWTLFEAYGELERLEDRRKVAAQLRDRLRQLASDPEAASSEFWVRAHRMLQTLDEPDMVLNCLEEAVRRDPGDLNVRRELAQALLLAGRPERALRHLEWCRLGATAAEDVQLQQMLVETRSQAER